MNYINKHDAGQKKIDVYLPVEKTDEQGRKWLLTPEQMGEDSLLCFHCKLVNDGNEYGLACSDFLDCPFDGCYFVSEVKAID